MQKVIYKYALEITDEQRIKLPKGSEVLSVANQRGQLQMWAMIPRYSINDEEEFRIFEIIGTGNRIDDVALGVSRKFIGTVVIEPYVWHVFELIKA